MATKSLGASLNSEYGFIIVHDHHLNIKWFAKTILLKLKKSLYLFSKKQSSKCIFDSLQSSHQRLEWNSLPLSNVKFAFCGFRTKNETC
eukprot:UN23578